MQVVSLAPKDGNAAVLAFIDIAVAIADFDCAGTHKHDFFGMAALNT
jgi:hypothetical protein